MKKILIALLTLAVALSVVSCGKKAENSGTSSPTEETEPGVTEPGTDPTGTEPETTEPAQTETEATEPAPTESEATEPEETTKPPETKPQTTKPPETKPQTTNPPETKPQTTKPPETKPQTTNPPETKPQATDPGKTDPQTSEPQPSLPGIQFPGGIVTPGGGSESPETPVADAGELVDQLKALCAGVVDVQYPNNPNSTGTLRSSASFNNYFKGKVQYTEGMRVAENHLEMAPPAHVVLLIETPAGKDPATFAKELEDNANPAWNICAIADSVRCAVKGNLILFVMSSSEVADALVAAFNG